MRSFGIDIDIDATSERVWQVMSDIERWYEWTRSVIRIQKLDSGPLEIGSRAVVRQPRFPPARWTVTNLDPGRGFTWRSVGPGMRVLAHHSVEPVGKGSRATLGLEYHGLLGPVFATLTREVTERYLGMEARGLKSRSEDPGFRA